MTDITIQAAAFGSDSLKLRLGKKTLACFVLNDGQRVLASESIPKALGYDGKSENWLFEFLMSINRLTPIEPALLESLGRAVIFQAGSTNIVRHGIDSKTFIEACRAIVKAKNDGFLYLSELRFAKAAEDILRNVPGDDLKTAIDLASGFSLFKQNHKDALVRKLTKATLSNYPAWLNTIADDFYELIFKFQGWNWQDLNNDAEKVGEFFNEILFSRIESPLLEQLETTRPKKKYRKENNPESYVENPSLKEYILQISALINASGMNPAIFEQLVNKSFPKKRELEIDKMQNAKPPTAENRLLFDDRLKKALQNK